MPQLDFFTFPHQYLIASICFCGLYYFNLLFFFSWIKFFHLHKIFAIHGFIANKIIISGDILEILKDLFSLEISLFTSFNKWSKKLQRKFFLKWLTAIANVNKNFKNTHALFLLLFLSFLTLFIFFKNFLIFNAEKLMLIYFLLISLGLFVFLKNFLNKLLQQDLKNFLSLTLELELEGEKNLNFYKFYLNKLRTNSIFNQLELILVKNLEIKLIKKLNDN